MELGGKALGRGSRSWIALVGDVTVTSPNVKCKTYNILTNQTMCTSCFPGDAMPTVDATQGIVLRKQRGVPGLLGSARERQEETDSSKGPRGVSPPVPGGNEATPWTRISWASTPWMLPKAMLKTKLWINVRALFNKDLALLFIHCV